MIRGGLALILIAGLALTAGLQWLFGFVDRETSRCTSVVGSARRDIATFADLVEQFRTDCGRYPTSSAGLKALNTQPPGTNGWYGPYMKKAIPLDPWGHPYTYIERATWTGTGFSVGTYGADGAPGGEGDNQDFFEQGISSP